jgi:hypothetical protein
MNLSDESTCRESSGVSDSKTPVTADERLSSKSTVYSIFGLRPQSLEEPNEQRFSSDVLVQSQERGKNDQEASLPVTRQAAAAGCGAQSCDSIATVPQLTGTSLQSRNSEPGLSNPKEAANSFEPASSSSSLSSSSAPYAKPLDTSCAPAPTGIFQTRHAQLKLDRGELWKLRSVFEAHDPPLQKNHILGGPPDLNYTNIGEGKSFADDLNKERMHKHRACPLWTGSGS